MDEKRREECGEGVKVSDDSKLKGVGNVSGKNSRSMRSGEMIFRADKIDLKDLDMQLEKHLTRVWSRNLEHQNSRKPKEEWEIDPLKLEIRYLVAQGSYGTVYRGTYDTQDVAGTIIIFIIICIIVIFHVIMI